MAVTRSPKYPQMSILDAVERVKQIYDREKWHPATDEVLVQQMGYRGLNGASLGTLATLKRYGLLVSAGDGKFRVSDDAISIIEAPKDHPDWGQAVVRAAFSPSLFAELQETFGSNLPSDANLRHFLIKKKFNPKAAEEVIRVYRETLNTVTAIQQAIPSEVASAIDANDLTTASPSEVAHEASLRDSSLTNVSVQQALGSTNGTNVSEVFNIRLSSDCKAFIQYEGVVTQRAIQKLIKYLELGMDDFPSDEEA